MLREFGIRGDLIASVGSVGAGAFPLTQLASVALALEGNAERWATALRAGAPAVVGRVHDGRLLLDFRAIPDAEVDAMVEAVRAAHE
jgi:L-seryl-tRNA(Ser) seleniumtransferase